MFDVVEINSYQDTMLLVTITCQVGSVSAAVRDQRPVALHLAIPQDVQLDECVGLTPRDNV